MEANQFTLYVITNHRRSALYVGVTNNLAKRMLEHRSGVLEGFAKKYNCKKLVLVESFPSAEAASAREKELKDWSRVDKEALITAQNAEWKDLYDEVV